MNNIEKDRKEFDQIANTHDLFQVHEVFQKEGEGYMISAFKTDELLAMMEKFQKTPMEIPGIIRDKVAIVIFDSLKGITKNESNKRLK